MKKQLIGVALIVFLIFPVYLYAGAPLDSVKSHVNKVLDVLRDPSFKGEAGKKNKKTKMGQFNIILSRYR